MKEHIYIDGTATVVSEEYANDMVHAGRWYRCEDTHHQGIAPDAVVYHKEYRKPKP